MARRANRDLRGIGASRTSPLAPSDCSSGIRNSSTVSPSDPLPRPGRVLLAGRAGHWHRRHDLGEHEPLRPRRLRRNRGSSRISWAASGQPRNCPTSNGNSTSNSLTNDLPINQELDLHIEGPVGAERASVTGDENDSMLGRRRAYERVVHGAPRHAARDELHQQGARSSRGKEPAFREVSGHQRHHRRWRPTSGGSQARQHQERLEDRMTCKAENPVAECLSGRLVLLVIANNERHRHARVDKGVGCATSGRHHATYGAYIYPVSYPCVPSSPTTTERVNTPWN